MGVSRRRLKHGFISSSRHTDAHTDHPRSLSGVIDMSAAMAFRKIEDMWYNGFRLQVSMMVEFATG
jgi:hypothetical protein